MPSEESGLNLFEDNASAAGGFPRATVGGYQRQPVDDYLRHLEGQLTQTRQRCRALELEVGRLERELANRPSLRDELDFSDLGGYTSQILSLARAQAKEVLAEADAAAAQRTDATEREVAALRADAEQEAADVRSAALEEARVMRARLTDDTTGELERARAEAAAIVAAAQREAETVQLRAHAAAEDATQKARLAAEQTVAAAQQHANQTRAASAQEREAAVAEMDRARGEHERRTTELFEQAAQNARESQERLAADIAEGTRIRTLAQQEAERLKATTLRQTEDRLATAHQQAQAMQHHAAENFEREKERMGREIATLQERRRQLQEQLSLMADRARDSANGAQVPQER